MRVGIDDTVLALRRHLHYDEVLRRTAFADRVHDRLLKARGR
jgi:hypothetical protein